MTAKYFCDRCENELKDEESGRLIVESGRFGVEVIHKIDGVWNAGNICWKCIREVCVDGKPPKAVVEALKALD